MPFEADLVAAIIADPESDQPRLVYADWLDQHGDSLDRARGELIRVQCQLASRDGYFPNRALLEGRSEQLQADYGDLWRDQLPQPPEGGAWGGLRRGFYESVTITLNRSPHQAASLSPWADQAFRATPLQSLAVLEVTDARLTELLSLPYLHRLIRLSLRPFTRGPHGSCRLAECESLKGLRHLEIISGGIGNSGLSALLDSRLAEGLQTLSLPNNRITDTGLRRLANTPAVVSLRSLNLNGNRLTDASADILIRCPYLKNLRQLQLRGQNFSMAVRQRLQRRFYNQVWC